MHRFAIEGLEHDLRVVHFEGHEGLSELFELEVVVVCSADDLAFDDAVGRPALLTFLWRRSRATSTGSSRASSRAKRERS